MTPTLKHALPTYPQTVFASPDFFRSGSSVGPGNGAFASP